MFTLRLRELTDELGGPHICPWRTLPSAVCPLPPSSLPRCRVSQPKQNQLDRWQTLCTCNIIVPVMKSASTPEGELRRVFWHRHQLDLQVYKSSAPPGLNHRLDEASAAWRQRVANCVEQKERESSRCSGELLLQLL